MSDKQADQEIDVSPEDVAKSSASEDVLSSEVDLGKADAAIAAASSEVEESTEQEADLDHELSIDGDEEDALEEMTSPEEGERLLDEDGAPVEMIMSPKERAMHESISLKSQVEAAVFAAPKPLKPADLIAVVSHDVSLKEMETLLQELQEEYNSRAGGFTLEYVRSLGYQFQTIAEVSPIMEKLFASRPRPLSKAALETLAIIAYRQPTTRASIEFIRGVDSGSIVKNLLERELIKCVGRKEEAGRPMIFGTTDEFLQVFGINSLKDLPPLQAFQPNSETMSDAMKELETLEQVDVEQFVADEDEDLPELSDGLIDDELEAGGPSQESESGDAAPEEQVSADSDGAEELDASSEVVVTAGDSVEAGSRALD